MRLRTAATDRCRDRIGMIATDRDRRHPQAAGRSEAVHLEEAADGFRDLLVTLLADDQPVVRVCAEWLVVRPEPGCKPLRCRLRHDPVEARADGAAFV